MALKDIFKKKKKPEAAEKKETKELKGVKEPKKKPEVSAVSKIKKEGKKFSRSWQVLKSPHVTEKASALAGKNDYVFKVFDRTNKKEVKEAVKSIFGVDVLGVKIINVPRKKRRLGKIKGMRPGYKKAVVKVKEGQKIEILPR